MLKFIRCDKKTRMPDSSRCLLDAGGGRREDFPGRAQEKRTGHAEELNQTEVETMSVISIKQ